jgi:glycosyltransferase involved in cell wall biosynthesis
MRASLVIPCYNEARSLPRLLQQCDALVRTADAEVILVDNGSTDDTPDALADMLPRHFGCRSVRVEHNQGYGYGILAGLRAAQGAVIGWTHADLQTDPGDVRRGLELFTRHGDDIFVKGRRYGRPAGDVFFTVGMSVFETLLLRAPLWDINAQPTLFSRKFFEQWMNPPHDFALDLYAYYQARRKGVPVYRFPVRFGRRAHGLSHWNVNWAAKRRFITRTVQFSVALRREMRAAAEP